MGLLARRAGIVAIQSVSLALMLLGCDDGQVSKRQKEQLAQKQADEAARSERYEAEREAEKRLLASPAAAETLNNRLDEWLVREGDLLLVKGAVRFAGIELKYRPWHSMPRATPWFISCGRGGLTVHLGTWSETSGEGEGVRTNDVFQMLVTRSPLSDEQCRELVVSVGRKMLQLTGGG